MPDISTVAEITSHIEGFDCFPVSKAKQAPDEVGIYAWYSLPNIGKPDWEKLMQEGVDVGRERFLQLLDRHTNRHKQPALSASLKGSFEQRLEGDLEDLSYARLTEAVKNPSVDTPSAKLEEVIGSPKMRGSMVNFLAFCAPLLTAPIYIGVAKSLRERLATHVNDLRRKQTALTQEESVRELLLEKEKSSFGTRATAMGFSSENLFVITFAASILDEEADDRTTRTVVEAVEWMLNRWNRPLLGRS